MCKGGLIMDVVNVEQAKIAEEAGVKLPFVLCVKVAKNTLKYFIYSIHNTIANGLIENTVIFTFQL